MTANPCHRNSGIEHFGNPAKVFRTVEIRDLPLFRPSHQNHSVTRAMKSIHLFAVLAISISISPALADKADDAYRKGMSAIAAGDVSAARSAFQEALKLRPNHAYARFQLGQLDQDNGQITARKRASELASVRLPNVEFKDVPLSDALIALNQLVEDASAQQFGKDKSLTPNFNIQDPTGRLSQKEVTIQLKNVPAKAALDYLLQQAGAKVRYDEFATVITPN